VVEAKLLNELHTVRCSMSMANEALRLNQYCNTTVESPPQKESEQEAIQGILSTGRQQWNPRPKKNQSKRLFKVSSTTGILLLKKIFTNQTCMSKVDANVKHLKNGHITISGHALLIGMLMSVERSAHHRECHFWCLSSSHSEDILDIPLQLGQSTDIQMGHHHQLPIQDGHPGVSL
jgi:hypothetical protein